MEAHNSETLTIHYSSDWSVDTIFEKHFEFEKQFGGQEVRTARNAPARKKVGERLKIGYVSPDFRTHSVAYLFESLIRAHDKTTVETFCYYNDKIDDETTKRLKNLSEHWRSIVGQSDNDVVDLIQRDGIDFLVDRAGHTANNRLTLFARKPAPIQVTWLGYPDTTGLSAGDYHFTDIVADPVGEADKFHTEKLIRLPNGFHCYRGDATVSANSELPFGSRGHITFGSLKNLTKVTPQVVLTWARILRELPISHLLLKSKQLENSSICSRFLDLFRESGVSEDRFDLHAYLPGK